MHYSLPELATVFDELKNDDEFLERVLDLRDAITEATSGDATGQWSAVAAALRAVILVAEVAR
jgi:hypothetical protein